MIPKKFIIYFAIVVLVIVFAFIINFVIGIIYKKETTIEPQKKLSKINFGCEVWPGFLLVPLAEKLGYFREENLLVNTIVYDGIDSMTRDYLNGKLDARAGFASDVLTYKDKDLRPEKIVLITDYSLGGDGVVGKIFAPPLNEAKRPKIGLAGEIDFFTLWILKKMNQDLETIDLKLYDSEQKLLDDYSSGTVNYIITYDPYLNDAYKSGGRYEYTSRDDPGVITDVISFQTSYIKNHKNEVESFLRGYFKAYAYWEKYPEESYKIVGPMFDINEAEFSSLMKNLKLLSKEDNISAMNISTGLNSLYGNLRIINLFLSDYSDKLQIVNTDSFIYSDAIKSFVKR